MSRANLPILKKNWNRFICEKNSPRFLVSFMTLEIDTHHALGDAQRQKTRQFVNGVKKKRFIIEDDVIEMIILVQLENGKVTEG